MTFPCLLLAAYWCFVCTDFKKAKTCFTSVMDRREESRVHTIEIKWTSNRLWNQFLQTAPKSIQLGVVSHTEGRQYTSVNIYIKKNWRNIFNKTGNV
jgi:hypothetical protein